MPKSSLNSLVTILRVCIIVFILSLLSLILFSFTLPKLHNAILPELGIGNNEAGLKICKSIPGGYRVVSIEKNARNIVLNHRAAVSKDLLAYTKQNLNTAAFKK